METLSTAWTRARDELHVRMERLAHQRRLELGHAAYHPAEDQEQLDSRIARTQTPGTAQAHRQAAAPAAHSATRNDWTG